MTSQVSIAEDTPLVKLAQDLDTITFSQLLEGLNDEGREFSSLAIYKFIETRESTSREMLKVL